MGRKTEKVDGQMYLAFQVPVDDPEEKADWYKNHSIGLQDKNGKLVHEGNILRDKNGEEYKVVWDKEEARFLLEYVDFLNGEIYKSANHVYCPMFKINNLEVIDNE